MAKAAEAALDLDLTASWVAGDRPEDIGLAEAVGASAIYLGPEDRQRLGVRSFPSLAAAGPAHPGAHSRMSSIYDLRAPAPSVISSPAKFPAAPHGSAASFFEAYAAHETNPAGTNACGD